ncbi:hypothetical protein CD30_05870 [Ureibacillus massiliensis 4400831 = CIP 108448 = CCUG 49529]|uniref:Na+-translocating membrane potential-generating system MpsC domain-containing protein n=1 Tax=Ureibacillus massiliensis 4400831 = CIP 108448 = CCUG 49529 TaxID=1211035 RepID=A0A0A3J878_9BACL|nr:Na-translocating system protein MpsC family protein [Ureibacillus massiliensis]KGR91348.1 hypothetical protein CD30_05870 [Ureibacillus massiliensis 4400831 = CIP 108448 = CCUG 49529]
MIIQISNKDVARLNIKVYQEIFGVGVHDQKIDISDNKIIILAGTKRIVALDSLSEEYGELVSALDAALSTKYKNRIKEELEALYNIKVIGLFGDYDPKAVMSCIVVCFEIK